MKVSSLLGKIAEGAGGKRGYVISANVNGRGEVFLKCADENEREFTVLARNITGADEKVTFSEGQSAPPPCRALRIGTAAVDEKGAYIGVIEEFFLKDGRISKVKIGKKNYPAERLTLGDVVIVKTFKKLKSDVTKNGKIILKKGAYLTEEAAAAAEAEGEYVQTRLKTI